MTGTNRRPRSRSITLASRQQGLTGGGNSLKYPAWHPTYWPQMRPFSPRKCPQTAKQKYPRTRRGRQKNRQRDKQTNKKKEQLTRPRRKKKQSLKMPLRQQTLTSTSTPHKRVSKTKKSARPRSYFPHSYLLLLRPAPQFFDRCEN